MRSLDLLQVVSGTKLALQQNPHFLRPGFAQTGKIHKVEEKLKPALFIFFVPVSVKYDATRHGFCPDFFRGPLSSFRAGSGNELSEKNPRLSASLDFFVYNKLQMICIISRQLVGKIHLDNVIIV